MQNNVIKENILKEFEAWHAVDQSWAVQTMHYHDVYEIYLCLTDQVQCLAGGSIFTLNRGDLVVFNNFDLHLMRVPENIEYKRYCAVFLPEYVREFLHLEPTLLDCFGIKTEVASYKITLEESCLKRLENLFQRAIELCKQEGYGNKINRKIILIEMLLLINPLYQNFTASSLHEQSESGIHAILDYINQFYCEDVSLSQLEKKFFLSKQHLCVLFKKGTGFTVNEYIIRRRLLKACELLNQNISVSRVRELIGYKDDAHFIRMFKRFTGITPKQYSMKKQLD